MDRAAPPKFMTLPEAALLGSRGVRRDVRGNSPATLRAPRAGVHAGCCAEQEGEAVIHTAGQRANIAVERSPAESYRGGAAIGMNSNLPRLDGVRRPGANGVNRKIREAHLAGLRVGEGFRVPGKSPLTNRRECGTIRVGAERFPSRVGLRNLKASEAQTRRLPPYPRDGRGYSSKSSRVCMGMSKARSRAQSHAGTALVLCFETLEGFRASNLVCLPFDKEA